MITLNSYFDKIICINRAARTDRWQNVNAQRCKFDFDLVRFNAHEATDCIDHLGNPNANYACTASHRGVLELICHNRWRRTLVLEDDFQIIEDSFCEQFDAMIGDVPDDWDFLFLGAGYAEAPKHRVNGSVIRANGLMTTSSYGITYDMARKMAPKIHSIGPIDSLYQQWERENVTYVLSPRLMVQADGMSDLTGQFSRNSNSMLDKSHEDALDGVTNPNE